MKQTSVIAAALTGTVIAFSAPASAQTAAGNLPGGATSLQETHGDWQVACFQRDGGKHCQMAQRQANPKTKQQLLEMDLRIDDKGTVLGVLVLPFGLALDAGIVMNVDAGAPAPNQGFVTCLPSGCLVPFTLNDAMTTAMRRGAKLNITATAYQNKKPVAMAVSLKGFSAALDRLLALAK